MKPQLQQTQMDYKSQRHCSFMQASVSGISHRSTTVYLQSKSHLRRHPMALNVRIQKERTLKSFSVKFHCSLTFTHVLGHRAHKTLNPPTKGSNRVQEGSISENCHLRNRLIDHWSPHSNSTKRNPYTDKLLAIIRCVFAVLKQRSTTFS